MKRIATDHAEKFTVIKWQLYSLKSEELYVIALFNISLLIVGRNCFGHNIQADDNDIGALVGHFKSNVTISRTQIQIAFSFDQLAKVQEAGQMLIV